jgi:hypothetical protein
MADTSWLDAASSPVPAAKTDTSWLDEASSPVTKAALAPRERSRQQLRSMLGREPTQDELASSMTTGGPSDLTAGHIGATAIPAAAELALTGGTGVALAPIAAARYAYGLLKGEGHEEAKARAGDILQYMYQPKTDVGQGVLGTIGDVSQSPIKAYQAAAYGGAAGAAALGLPTNPEATAEIAGKQGEGAALLSPLIPGAQGAIAAARNPAAISGVLRGAMEHITRGFDDPEGVADAQAVLNRVAAESPQSQGAAAAAPQVANASPELQQAVADASRKNGGQINQQAAQRHLQADRLGVRLTEGDATGDAETISDERNNPELATHRQKTNEALVDRLDDTRHEVAPDVHTTNQTEHGAALIDAYKENFKPLEDAASDAWEEATKANGGQFPVDAGAVARNADAALKASGKVPFLPAAVDRILQGYRDGDSMSLVDYDNLRTTLSNEARKAARASDGNAGIAISAVRDALENAPMSAEAAPVKALYDKARAATKAKYDALRQDPAMEAAINDEVTPDQFTQKFLLGNSKTASQRQAQVMRAAFADNPQALQTLSASVVDHLRDHGVTSGGLKQSGYNSALTGLDTKLKAVLTPRAAERLSDIGDVARYTQAQPAGSFVNNSHSGVAIARGLGGTLARGGLRLAAEGLPFGRIIAGGIERGAEALGGKAAAARALRPGAGIDVVPGVMNPHLQAMLRNLRTKAEEEMAFGATARRTLHAAHNLSDEQQ